MSEEAESFVGLILAVSGALDNGDGGSFVSYCCRLKLVMRRFLD